VASLSGCALLEKKVVVDKRTAFSPAVFGDMACFPNISSIPPVSNPNTYKVTFSRLSQPFGSTRRT
jgi:hypothetical protein